MKNSYFFFNKILERFLLLFFCFISIFLIPPLSNAQIPSINSFSPSSGSIGTIVTINGNNFSPVAANNIVYFGAVMTSVLTASSSLLTVNVPIGATYQSISVTVNGLTAYSSKPFTVTFTGGESGFSVNSFSREVDSTTGGNTTGLAIADFNQDGKPDLAVISNNDNKIGIFKNTSISGIVSFTSKINFSTGDRPFKIAIADFDGDGKKDIVVSNSNGNSISVFRNTSMNDSISFLPKIDFAAGSSPGAISIGDFDQDGKPDIVVANTGSGSVSIFKNISSLGNIVFAAKSDFDAGPSPSGIAINDIDGDGKIDLTVISYDADSVSVLRNISTNNVLSFDTRINFFAIGAPTSICTADWDDDGKPDLAITGSNLSAVSLLKNNSSPGNISFSDNTNFSIFSASTDISAGDLDGDGRPDIVATNNLYKRISILKNISKNDTIFFSSNINYDLQYEAYVAEVEDIDGDGKLDVVTGNTNPGVVSVLLNTIIKPHILSFTPNSGGNGSAIKITGINLGRTTAVSFGGSTASSFFVDSSGTIITAVVDTGSTGAVKVITNYGTDTSAGFTFERLPVINFFQPVRGGTGTTVTITGINFSDINSVTFGGQPAASFTIISPTVIQAMVGAVGTGSLDVSITNSAGTGTLSGFYTGPIVNSFSPSSGPVGTIVTINGDHFSVTAANNIVYFGAARASVLTATATMLTVIVPAGATYQYLSVTVDSLITYSSHPFTVTFKETGEFTSTSFVHVLDSVVGNFPVHTSVMDLNDDGKLDLVTSNFASNSISVLKNTSNAGIISLLGKVDYSVGNSVVQSLVKDLDGDGKADIVVIKKMDNVSLTDSFSVFRNIANTDSISFISRQDFLVGYEDEPNGVFLGDFNYDGKPDLVLAGSKLKVFKNTSTPGVISFASPIQLGTYSQDILRSVAVSDLDGDGLVDIIAIDANNDVVYIYRNTSAGGQITFSPFIALTTDFTPEDISIGDIDNDGRPDLVVTKPGSNSVLVFQNTSGQGNISFIKEPDYALGNIPYNGSISDLNGDGKPDLAIATHNNSSVSILKNTTTNNNISFSDHVDYSDGYNPRHISLGDMNGDGRPDLIITNQNGNNVSIFTNSLSDDGLPSISIIAIGPTEFCEGDSVILKTNELSGATYQWYNDGNLISLATDSTFKVTSPGSYSVKVTNGGNSATSAPILVTVKPIPPVPIISLTGNNPFCQGSSIILTSSASGSNQWYSNNSLLVGSSNKIYNATAAGIYKVITKSNGCSSLFSDSIAISMIPVPDAQINASSLTFCAGDSVLLNALTGNGWNYQWNINENPIVGATTPTFTSTIPGNFSVTTSSNGCSQTSAFVIVTMKPVPNKPTITQVGSNLVSNAVNGNQWYKDGVLLPGANNQTYAPTSSGNYTVVVTIDGCESSRSANYNFIVTGIISIDNTHFIRLSPNPVNDLLKLDFNIAGTISLNVELIDLEGKTLRVWRNIKSGTGLNLFSIPQGIYVAEVYNRDGKLKYALKVIKI
jgi:hypothetical protein